MGRKRSRICVRGPICVEVCIQSDLGRRAARSAPGHAARIVAGLHADAMHPALGVAVADLPPDGGRRVLAQDEAPVRVAARNEADHGVLKDGLRGDSTAQVPGSRTANLGRGSCLGAAAVYGSVHLDHFTLHPMCYAGLRCHIFGMFRLPAWLKPYVEQEITRLNDERLKALDWQEGSGRLLAASCAKPYGQDAYGRKVRTRIEPASTLCR